MNGQQLHRVLLVPASVAQPRFHWLVVLSPATSGVRAGKGGEETQSHAPHGWGRCWEKTHTQCGEPNLPPLAGITGSDGEGGLLEVISRSKSFKLAFSKSQQYQALFFFSLFNKLVNTLKFTFLYAVDQRHHQCLLGLVSESLGMMYIEFCSSLRWVQTSLFSAYSEMKESKLCNWGTT